MDPFLCALDPSLYVLGPAPFSCVSGARPVPQQDAKHSFIHSHTKEVHWITCLSVTDRSTLLRWQRECCKFSIDLIVKRAPCDAPPPGYAGGYMTSYEGVTVIVGKHLRAMTRASTTMAMTRASTTMAEGGSMHHKGVPPQPWLRLPCRH